MAKILLVEDNVGLVEAYSKMLQAEGHETEHASNGQEALDKVQQFSPDLILLDMLMPGTNGLDFLKGYESFPEPHARIIVLSNMDTMQTKLEASKLGAQQYVVKASMSPGELAELIRQNT